MTLNTFRRRVDDDPASAPSSSARGDGSAAAGVISIAVTVLAFALGSTLDLVGVLVLCGLAIVSALLALRAIVQGSHISTSIRAAYILIVVILGISLILVVAQRRNGAAPAASGKALPRVPPAEATR